MLEMPQLSPMTMTAMNRPLPRKLA